MPIDLARARAETPGCETVAHFNNAGASLPPRPVVEAVVEHLELEARIGGYEAAERRDEAVERVYHAAAALLSCAPDEIAIVENATRAWDMAFYALPLHRGDRILTSMAEYASNYIAFLQVAGRTGAVVEAVPNDEHGQLSVEALRSMLDERVRLIAVTHVPTNGGLVNPAAQIGSVAREAGVPYLLDACQSAGQIPLDVPGLGCDVLSATGRKYLRGPRGTGLLYVRRELLERLEPPFLDLHAAEWIAPDRYTVRPDARRFENWESFVAGKIGLGVAIDYALDWGLDAIYARVRTLAEDLRRRLAALPGVTVRDLGRERCGIVSFTVEGCEPARVRARLAQRGINVHTSPRRYTLLDMDERGLREVVRASVHYYNSEEEVDHLCAGVAAL
jgi:selenocysteine lyase/cysteine desulfurase